MGDSKNPAQFYEEVPGGKYDKAAKYTRECDCGQKHIVFTQKDNCPEYYTDVSVQCDCGKLVTFELPVN